MKYTLSNDVLAGFVQLFQLALLTGTDISDHLRLLEVEADASGQQVTLTAECRERLQRNIDDLDKRAAELRVASASDA
jgi:hypothetical protein